jgi:hypothetical protein
MGGGMLGDESQAEPGSLVAAARTREPAAHEPVEDDLPVLGLTPGPASSTSRR